MISMQEKRISTAFVESFLLIFLPQKPPVIPETIITPRANTSIGGTEKVASVKIRLAVCAKKII